jgi:hypothetical protein
MLRINLKRSIATVSVIASVLAVAGPASAAPRGIDVRGVDRGLFSADAYDNEMGITTEASSRADGPTR